MTNTNRNVMAGIFIGTVLILGIMIAPMTISQVNAQSKKLTCDTTKDCNIIIRRLRVGDDLIIQFKASPITGGGGSGGTNPPPSTVDQQARDDITELKTSDAAQTNDIQRLQEENTDLAGQVSELKANLTVMNEAEILQTQAIQELQSAVKNITDANPFVDLNVTGNENASQGEPNPVPPQGNETTGNGENTTTPTPPAGNESTTNPPDNTTTTNPPTGNESNGQVTHPIQCAPNEFYNSTTNRCESSGGSPTEPGSGNGTSEIGNNVTVPIEGNITLPGGGGETNVTLPIDNSSGNIIIGNETGAVSENETNVESNDSTVQGDIIDSLR